MITLTAAAAQFPRPLCLAGVVRPSGCMMPFSANIVVYVSGVSSCGCGMDPQRKLLGVRGGMSRKKTRRPPTFLRTSW